MVSSGDDSPVEVKGERAKEGGEKERKRRKGGVVRLEVGRKVGDSLAVYLRYFACSALSDGSALGPNVR